MRRGPSILFISTYPPQQCGIATFTRHLLRSLSSNVGPADTRVAAILRKGERPAFGREVVYEIDHAVPSAYPALAEFVNHSDIDAVSLQHEYGLFTGEWGSDVLRFLEACNKPVVTTLHTILPEPNGPQKEIIQAMATRSARLVAMANVGIDLLASVYGVPRNRTMFIPHGVPEFHPSDRDRYRRMHGFGRRKVILTFGLLSRGKGIEHVIDALPAIRERHGDVLYLVIGETHPNIRRLEGESYREELQKHARRLGVRDSISFRNQFMAEAELRSYIQACDVYVTPYLGRNQITSGTLSYAVAAGCAVVSTPYLYAEELLSGGRGRLAEFHSGESLAREISTVLGNPELARRLRARAYAFGRSMTWDSVGRQYCELFGRLSRRRVRPSRAPYAAARPALWVRPARGGQPDNPDAKGK